MSINVKYTDDQTIDAFGRLRVSIPFTTFSSKQLADKQPLIWDDQQTSGASTTSVYQTNAAATLMSVQGNVAGTRVRQTFRHFNYQPGKSVLIYLTGTLLAGAGATTGVTRTLGYLDGYNGVYFSYSGSTMNVGLRSYTTGSVVNTNVAQSSWNLDKMDGTGNSGVTLDFTKSQIFVIDFEWLGVGRIRYGFNIGGRTVYCHEILNANANTGAYTGSPNLPVRYEISSAGTGSAITCSLLHIYASVNVESGVDPIGISFAADRSSTALVTTNDSNIYSLLAIKLRDGYGAAYIHNLIYSVMTPTATSSWRTVIYLNPTIAGTDLSFNPVNGNSAVQYAIPIANNLITAGSGVRIYSNYEQANHTNNQEVNLPNELVLGMSIAGVSDILVLAVQPCPNSAISFYGSLSWRETI